MINESGISLLKDKEPFGRQELIQVLEEQYKGLSQAFYKLKMQRLLESGQITRAGRNLYCIPDNQMPIYYYEYSGLTTEIQEIIYEKHPFLEYRIFAFGLLCTGPDLGIIQGVSFSKSKNHTVS